MACIVFLSTCVLWLRKRIGRSRTHRGSVAGGRRREREMRGVLMQQHQISTNPLRRNAFAASSALVFSRRDGVLLHAAALRRGFLRSSCLSIRAEEGDDVSPPLAEDKKHSREELIAFFRDIQTSIAMESPPKTSRRTRKPSLDEPFEEVARRKQAFEDRKQDGQRHALNLEDMKVAELRELARFRQMRGYSRLKKAELLDRLKGLSSL